MANSPFVGPTHGPPAYSHWMQLELVFDLIACRFGLAAGCWLLWLTFLGLTAFCHLRALPLCWSPFCRATQPQPRPQPLSGLTPFDRPLRFGLLAPVQHYYELFSWTFSATFFSFLFFCTFRLLFPFPFYIVFLICVFCCLSLFFLFIFFLPFFNFNAIRPKGICVKCVNFAGI